MSRHLCLALAIVSASGFLAACETDDSLPTHPRTGFLTPSASAQENAERKALEGPSRSVPGGGGEFPGQQSSATGSPDRAVVTLAADAVTPASAPVTTPTNPDFPIKGFTGPTGWDSVGRTHGPETTYSRDLYTHAMPLLPANPGTVPMAGFILTPDKDTTIDNSWGQGLTLENYPHRPWPQETIKYESGIVTHNPLYYFNLEDHIDICPPEGPKTDNIRSTLIEIPWFFGNTLVAPVFMVLEPPLAVRTTDRSSVDPNYRGSIPTEGPIVPVPVKGVLQWRYPFLNQEDKLKGAATNEAPATAPAPVQP